MQMVGIKRWVMGYLMYMKHYFRFLTYQSQVHPTLVTPLSIV